MNTHINNTIEILKLCQVCSSTKSKFLYNLFDRLYCKDPDPIFTYSKCSDCEATFLSKRVIEKHLGSYYPESYTPYTKGTDIPKKHSWLYFVGSRISKITAKPILKFCNRKLTSKITTLYKESKGVLIDYGCGGSSFLNQAKKLGWETIGLDFTEFPVTDAKKSGHKSFLIDESLEENILDDTIDLLRMNHVFEHIYHPHQTTEFVYSKLKKGGVFHIAMPNPNGISVKFWKEHALAIECPRHVILYPPQLVIEILQKAGFSHIEFLGEYASKDFCRSTAIWLKTKLKAELPLDSVLTANEKPFADVFYSPITLLSRILNMPDRYHIIAIKD